MKTALFEYSFAAPLTPDAILFLEQETNVSFHHLDMREWLCVTAWNDHGAVVGVLTMEPRNWFDWHMSCAIADQRLMNRKLLRAIFRATFSRAKRITALVEPNNERVLAQIQRLGFQLEGFGRRIIEGTRDAYMFAMLAEDCPWLGKMRPRLPSLDHADVNLMDPVIEPDQSARSGIGTNGPYLTGRKTGLLVALAGFKRRMAIALRQIGLACQPPKMARIDAAGNAATVSGVVAIGGLAMGEPADDAMHLARRFAFPSHLRITPRIGRQWPEKALVAFVGQRGLNDFLASHGMYNREA